MFVGDFNAPDINWSTFNASSHFSDCLCSCLCNNNLVQLVSNPTHVRGNINILDLVVTNASERLSTVHIDNSSHSSSDHFLISMHLNSYSSKLGISNSLSFTYMYAGADFTAMSNYLFDNQTSVAPNIEETWSNLKHLVLQARDLFVPKFKIPKKPHPKWFDSVVRHQLNCTRTLRKKSRLRPTVTNHLKLLVAETELQSTMLTAKISSEFGQNPR